LSDADILGDPQEEIEYDDASLLRLLAGRYRHEENP